MLLSIKDYITNNYPEVKIVSATKIDPPKTNDSGLEAHPLNFYDVTFEYKGKQFSKLFHTRLKESIDKQFKEALTRCEIKYED